MPPGWSTVSSTCIQFHDFATSADKVQVVLPPRKSVVGLGAIFGYDGIQVSGRAQAQVRREPVPGCGLCVLSGLDTRGPVTLRGGDSFAAATGRVRTGGSDNGFLDVQDGGVITFASTPNPATGPYTPDPLVGSPPSRPVRRVAAPPRSRRRLLT